MIEAGIDFLIKHREKTSNAVLAEMLFNEMVKVRLQLARQKGGV